MIQDLYQEALKFAGEMHADQKVPGTRANYLLHISNVTMEVLLANAYENNFDLNYAVQIAILHDTIEDTAATFEDISQRFGEPIALAVQALTKDESISSKELRMLDSLRRINLLPKEVGLVKIADRITNLQKPPSHWSQDKVRQYGEESKTIYHALVDKNAYLYQRLEDKINSYERLFGHAER